MQRFSDDGVQNSELKTLNLTEADGKNKKNRFARNRLYEKFGIPLRLDQNGVAGHSENVKLYELNKVNTWENNIEEITLNKYCKNLMDEKNKLDRRNKSFESSLGETKKASKNKIKQLRNIVKILLIIIFIMTLIIYYCSTNTNIEKFF